MLPRAGRSIRCVAGIFFFFFTLFAAITADTAEKPDGTKGSPEISYEVFLQKDNVRESDSLIASIIVRNESNRKVENVRITIDAPCFITLGNTAGKTGTASRNAMFIGTIGPHQSILKNIVLLSRDSVVVGEYNLLFSFFSEWRAPDKTIHYAVAVESKKIKVSLLGSDSIANIPLHLVSIIVPGSIFIITITLLGLSWFDKLNTGDRFIYSILLSILIIAFSQALLQNINHPYPLLQYGPNEGISINKLLGLAGIGSLAGILLVIMVRIARFVSNQIRTAKLISVTISPEEENDFGTLLHKALKANLQTTPKKTRIREQSGAEYEGFFHARDNRGDFLLGNFKLNKSKLLPETRNKIMSLCQQHKNDPGNVKLMKIVELVLEESMKNNVRTNEYLSVANKIKKINMDGTTPPTIHHMMRWGEEAKIVISELDGAAELITDIETQ